LRQHQKSRLPGDRNPRSLAREPVDRSVGYLLDGNRSQAPKRWRHVFRPNAREKRRLRQRWKDDGHVDARSPEDYEAGHIQGSVSLPVGRFEEEIEAFLERYPPEASIITYCSGRTCLDSHHLAEFLLDFGYDKVTVFIDGFPGWEAEGHPIE